VFSMKNTIKLIGIIALAAAIGFSFAGCGDGAGGGGGTPPGFTADTTFSGADGSGNVYSLVITPARAAAGDRYVLTIVLLSDLSTKTSSGTVTGVSGGTLTLSGGGSLTVSGSAITAVTGTFTLDGNGGPYTGPGGLTGGGAAGAVTGVQNENVSLWDWDNSGNINTSSYNGSGKVYIGYVGPSAPMTEIGTITNGKLTFNLSAAAPPAALLQPVSLMTTVKDRSETESGTTYTTTYTNVTNTVTVTPGSLRMAVGSFRFVETGTNKEYILSCEAETVNGHRNLDFLYLENAGAVVGVAKYTETSTSTDNNYTSKYVSNVVSTLNLNFAKGWNLGYTDCKESNVIETDTGTSYTRTADESTILTTVRAAWPPNTPAWQIHLITD
jgi:hypothetical protein